MQHLGPRVVRDQSIAEHNIQNPIIALSVESLAPRTLSRFSHYPNQFLFRSTLRPAAGSATTTFLAAAVLAAVFFIAVLVAAEPFFSVVVWLIFVVVLPAFFTMVVLVLEADTLLELLWTLAELTVRVGSCCGCGVGRGGGAIVMAVDFVVFFSLLAVRPRPRAVAPAPRFACSTMPWREALMALEATEAAVLSGEAGFRGDVGRAM